MCFSPKRVISPTAELKSEYEFRITVNDDKLYFMLY